MYVHIHAPPVGVVPPEPLWQAQAQGMGWEGRGGARQEGWGMKTAARACVRACMRAGVEEIADDLKGAMTAVIPERWVNVRVHTIGKALRRPACDLRCA